MAENGEVSNTGEIDECGNMNLTCIGAATVPARSLSAVQYTIGEQVSSVLQLMKRYTRVKVVTRPSEPYLTINPFTLGVVLGHASSSPDYLDMSNDYVSYFSLMYALARGSMRMMAYSPTVEIPYATTQMLLIKQPTLAVFGESGWTDDTSSTYISNWPHGNVVQSVQTPAYNGMISRVIVPFVGGNADNSASGSPVWIRFRTSTANETAITTVQFFRAVGDDYVCGYFVGVPPLGVIYA
jgi:hypothetical protein